MAVLGQGVKLASFSAEKDTVFVDGSRVGKEIIVTSGGKHIHVYSVADRRCLYNWSARTGQEITCGAVINHITGNYAAVFNTKTIRTWNKEEIRIDKGKKLQVSKPVFKLLSVENWNPVILFQDGTVSWLSSDKSDPQGETQSSKIKWTSLQEAGGKLCLVVLQEQNKVVCYTWQHEAAEPHIVSFHIKAEAEPIYFCLHNENNALHLIHTYKDGGLDQTVLSGVGHGDKNTLPRLQTISTLLGMTSAGQSYLAVAGVSQQSSTQSQKEGIGIWDLKFGILQAWRELPENNMPKDQMQVLHLDGSICVMCGKSLYIYPVALSTSTLSAALGKFVNTSITQNTEKNASVKHYIEEMADPKKTPSHTQFKRIFGQFLKKQSADKEDVLLLQQPLTLLISRCLKEKKFWPRDELCKLIEKKLIPTNIYKDLFSELSERNELLMLHHSVSNLPDIPEVSMVTALNCMLRTEEATFSALIDVDMEEEGCDMEGTDVQCPFPKQKAAFINKVLQLSYNDVFLMECLNKLDFKYVITLLDHLHYLLATVPYTDESCRKDSPLSMVKVVEWICLVLDAHFTQLILTTDARKLLVNLHQLVESQVHLYEELVSLEGILNQLKERSSLPPKQPPGPYSISVLHLY